MAQAKAPSGMLFGLRFDFRNPDFARTTMADRYAAALDMAQWADSLGCVSIAVSEHHGSPDGYLPSPIPVLAAMAARTTNVRFLVAALIAPFHDPLRLAEEMVVLDHLSRGRVDLIVAGGYVHEEIRHVRCADERAGQAGHRDRGDAEGGIHRRALHLPGTDGTRHAGTVSTGRPDHLARRQQ